MERVGGIDQRKCITLKHVKNNNIELMSREEAGVIYNKVFWKKQISHSCLTHINERNWLSIDLSKEALHHDQIPHSSALLPWGTIPWPC